MKKIPEGYKQITLILPEEVIERLDEICKIENRKRPGQIQRMIEEFPDGLKKREILADVQSVEVAKEIIETLPKENPTMEKDSKAAKADKPLERKMVNYLGKK